MDVPSQSLPLRQNIKGVPTGPLLYFEQGRIRTRDNRKGWVRPGAAWPRRSASRLSGERGAAPAIPTGGIQWFLDILVINFVALILLSNFHSPSRGYEPISFTCLKEIGERKRHSTTCPSGTLRSSPFQGLQRRDIPIPRWRRRVHAAPFQA